MIEITQADSTEALAELRRDYLSSLAAPFDGMWEAFVAMSRPFEIRLAGEQAGYACLNDAGQLLQFHVAAPYESAATEIFTTILTRDDVKGAMVGTADALFLGLCLDAQQALRVHTLLYHDVPQREGTHGRNTAATFDVVQPGELDTIVELQRESLDQDPGDWLVGYVRGLIERRSLYAMRQAGDILGTGEARISESQPPYVDLGVITMRPHRGRGVAPDILGRLKRLCYERDLVPICSTTVENQASRRAIAKAGFVSRHRILDVGFQRP